MVVGTLLHNRYKKQQLLGQGSFGAIYKALDTKHNKDVALKEENIYGGHDQLIEERDLYEKLGKQKGYLKVFDYFEENSKRYLAFTLVGKSLETCLDKIGRKMNLKSTLLIARQLIDRIETLHQNDIIHRDIKPDNMAMGIGNDSSLLYMLDLGISKIFKYNNVHIRACTGKKLIGTARYASINSHKGYELSRRDDLESIAYVLIYLQKGRLPWQGKRSDYEETKYHKIYMEKMKYIPEALCKDLEPVFHIFLEYTRNLSFKEKPDYKYIKSLFNDLFIQKKFEDDNIYQWTKPSDPAYIAKKEATQKKLREEEELRRRRAIASQKKRLKRKRLYMAPSKDDLFFSPYLPLEQRQTIVLQNMANANFPSLLPPIYPPPHSKRQKLFATEAAEIPEHVAKLNHHITQPFESINLVFGISIDGKPIILGSKPTQVLVDVSPKPDDVVAQPIGSNNVVMDVSIDSKPVVLESIPNKALVDVSRITDYTVVLPVVLESEPIKALVDTSPKLDDVVAQPTESSNVILAVSIDGKPVVLESKPTEVLVDVSPNPNQPIVLEAKSTNPLGDLIPKPNNAAMLVKGSIQPATETKSKKKSKKRKVSAANLPPRDPNQKTRKQEQAEMLAMAQAQARNEQDRLELEMGRRKQEYINSRNAQYRKPEVQYPPQPELPSFQQSQVPYQPVVLFKPTFGATFGAPKENNFNDIEGYLLF